MSSAVDICNMALQSIAARSTIASLTENSNAARACNRIYDDTVDEVLSMAFWGFARKTATLAVLKQAPGTPGYVGPAPANWDNTLPSPPWLYEYGYPSDCVFLRFIPGGPNFNSPAVPIFSNDISASSYAIGPPVPFTIGTDTDSGDNQINVILTNQASAIAVYTMRVTNTNLYTPLFRAALESALAMKLVMPLSGDKRLIGIMAQQANQAITSARVADGNEGMTVQSPPTDWIDAREGYVAYTGSFVAPYPALYGSSY